MRRDFWGEIDDPKQAPFQVLDSAEPTLAADVQARSLDAQRERRTMTNRQIGHIDHLAWSPEEKLHYLNYVPQEARSVLDIGCGMGEFLSLLAKRDVRARGCDIDDDCVASSRRYAQVDKIDAESLVAAYGESTYDLVTAFHVLEHCRHPFRVLGEMKDVTRSYLLLAVPNARFIVTEERATHLFSWNRWTLTNLMMEAGLKDIVITEDWTNVYPRFLRIAPVVNRLILRMVSEKNELIALATKAL